MQYGISCVDASRGGTHAARGGTHAARGGTHAARGGTHAARGEPLRGRCGIAVDVQEAASVARMPGHASARCTPCPFFCPCSGHAPSTHWSGLGFQVWPVHSCTQQARAPLLVCIRPGPPSWFAGPPRGSQQARAPLLVHTAQSDKK